MEIRIKHIPNGYRFVNGKKTLEVGDVVTVPKIRSQELIARGIAEAVAPKKTKTHEAEESADKGE